MCLPRSILAHLLCTITLKTNIVCDGVVTLLASRLPHLQFRDPSPISSSTLISLTFPKNAHDVQTQRSADVWIQYIWILNPNPNNVFVALLNEHLNSNLSDQPHYCLQYAVPQSIIIRMREEEKKRKRRAEGLPFDSEEEEEEEEEESESEEEGEEFKETEPGEPSSAPPPRLTPLRSTPPTSAPIVPPPSIPSPTHSTPTLHLPNYTSTATRVALV